MPLPCANKILHFYDTCGLIHVCILFPYNVDSCIPVSYPFALHCGTIFTSANKAPSKPIKTQAYSHSSSLAATDGPSEQWLSCLHGLSALASPAKEADGSLALNDTYCLTSREQECAVIILWDICCPTCRP